MWSCAVTSSSDLGRLLLGQYCAEHDEVGFVLFLDPWLQPRDFLLLSIFLRGAC